jgi:hypothetical protein
MSSTDAERESFKIFSQLSKSSQQTSEVDDIVNELLTMSLSELHELSILLNDEKLLNSINRKNSFAIQSGILAKNRSPFPHPKHLFAGIDADQRPGMHTVPMK